MNFELMEYYLKQAKWCVVNSSEPFISTMAYLKCMEDILDNASSHVEVCECGGSIYYVVASGGTYLQCSCCDWMIKG